MADKKKSPFDLADEQAARQRARDKRGPSKPPAKSDDSRKGSEFRKGRTPQEIADDAQRKRQSEAQNTDSNN